MSNEKIMVHLMVREIRYLQGRGFQFAAMYGPVLGHTESILSDGYGGLSPRGVKRSKRATYLWPLSSAECRERQELCLYVEVLISP